MTILQLSVFIENKSGTLVKVLNLLKDAKIQIIASTIADTLDYGIYRIICSDPSKAYTMLKDNGINVALSDVFAIQLNDEPGKAAEAVELFASESISIAYMYSFLLGGHGILVFRTDDAEHAKEVIILNKLNFITERNLAEIK